MNVVSKINETPQNRAIFNSPDNVFNWSWPKVPRHKFLKEKNEAYDFGKKSLLEWVISKKNSTINGFINHFWNGVTCLTLSNIIKNIIKNY